MKRRESILKIAVGFFTTVGIATVGTCRLLADHFSRYSWPSYPRESSLRAHLLKKPHYFSRNQVAKLTFEECREAHDKSHSDQGGKPPPQSRLWMNKTYKKKPQPKPRPPAPPIQQPVPAEPPTVRDSVAETEYETARLR